MAPLRLTKERTTVLVELLTNTQTLSCSMIVTQTSTTGPSQAQAGAERAHPSRSGRASHTTIVSQDESTGHSVPAWLSSGPAAGLPCRCSAQRRSNGYADSQQSSSTRWNTDAERCQRISGESYDLPPSPPSQALRTRRRCNWLERRGGHDANRPDPARFILIKSRWARNRPIFPSWNRPLRICTTAKGARLVDRRSRRASRRILAPLAQLLLHPIISHLSSVF